jgi:L-asparaginase
MRIFLRTSPVLVAIIVAVATVSSSLSGQVRLFAEPQSQAAAPPSSAAQESPALQVPRVYLFATGGTISNRQGGRLTVEELVKSIPNLERRVRAEGEQFANVSSGQITMDQWLDLARRVNDRFRKDADLAGVVVTSGTDTLEELAYFLHLTVRDERPVVVVGSMRNPSTLGYEGAANLEDAFRVAAEPQSRGMGTLVVLNDEINSAREVTKTDSRLLNTFSSRDYGVLGTIFDRVAYFRKPVRRHSAQSEFDPAKIPALPRVDVILTYQGAPGDIIKAAVDAGAKGIVIAGAGAGATSGTQGEGLSYAAEKGAFVVSTTRTGGGGVGGGGAGRTGAPAGAPAGGGTASGRGPSRRVSGDDLQPVKARILLMLALATTTDPAEVQRIFREY